MSKYSLKIDESKCLGCGKCVKDCVAAHLCVEDGKVCEQGGRCILCGHCEAICPTHAITLEGFEDEVPEKEEQVLLDPDTLMAAIRTRRSIRQFTDKQIPEEVIDMIFEAGRLAPTGSNAQAISYVLIRDRIAECEEIAVGMFRSATGIGRKISPAMANIDNNFFFKKAPAAIVLFADDKVSASLAAENMAFMAEANGLGVLYSGFFTICVNFSAKLRKLMGIPAKPKAVTTLVLGYPAVKYERSVHRKPAQITKV